MEIYTELVVVVVGAIVGVLVTIITGKYRENISTKKDQLKSFYAPLEILIRMNQKGFVRYQKDNTLDHDKEYIEKHIWHPNHIKTKELIMEQSHHLNQMPDEILDLLEHINVWLSEYDLIHVKNQKKGPVFVASKGYKYPKHVDQFIYDTTQKLRNELSEDF